MVVIGTFFWVLLIAWLVSAFYPSRALKQNATGLVANALIVLALLGGMIVLQYHLVAGHLHRAMMIDAAGMMLGFISIAMHIRAHRARHQ